MASFFQQILLGFLATLLFYTQPSIQDYSVSDMSDLGREFIPFGNSLLPLLTFTAKARLFCSLECNKRIDCRTFDFDGSSRQCRLWDADTTTGSIVASPSKPQSIVGTIRLSPNNYINSHNKSCDTCAYSRYEICDTNSSTCQCPSKTFWNGSMCLVQLLQNQICAHVDACRIDLNLTCQPSCDFTYRCVQRPAIGVGLTVAGFCNATIGSGPNDISGPWGIYVSPSDGSLYVTDWDLHRYQRFPQFSRTGNTFFSTDVYQPSDVLVDSFGNIYMIDGKGANTSVRVQQAGVIVRRFPALGLSTTSCLLNGLGGGYSIAVDRSGNVYVALYSCHAVVKWAPNATVGVLVAGTIGSLDWTSTTLNYPRYIHLNEDVGAFYVSDTSNNRVQKFIIGGNGTAVTIAGTSYAGTSLNQLNKPAGICVTRDGQTLYVADYNNHRIMKWTIGASQGSVIAGSASGVAGSTDKLLSWPGDISLDATETYLYVADYGNHRVQKIRVQ